MKFAEWLGINIKFKDFKSNAKGLMRGMPSGEIRVGIKIGLSQQESEFTIAHELAHIFLHIDKGNTITDPRHEEFEEQADRAAKMLLTFIRWQEICQGIGQNRQVIHSNRRWFHAERKTDERI